MIVFLLSFISLFAFNDLNEAQGHRPKTEIERALFPVASIFFVKRIFFIQLMAASYAFAAVLTTHPLLTYNICGERNL